MSADNWAECPKCGKGKVKDNFGTPLREDYEIGIYGGEFFISYSGMCRECDFEKKFEHSEQVMEK